ncbi:MFS transporter [Gordonia sp. CPCC 205333]|uniref:MFS transporter n=1 Tax=Gordonia sp. CPCC 205333 TaxID=3140790 RepID=UPI003AF4018A
MTSHERRRPVENATISNEVRSAQTVAPDRPVSRRWITYFALAWMGVWMAQLTPFQLVLPVQINGWLGLAASEVPEDQWQRSVMSFGQISGIAAGFALIAFPLVGALSDRTTSRFGRRRPWIVIGVLSTVIGLSGLGFQHTWVGMAVFWSIVITGFSATAAALTALISDQVPVNQRGVVSSWVSAPQALGILLGVAVIGALFGTRYTGPYLTLAICVVVLVAPFVWYLNDPPHPTHKRSKLTVRTLLSELWISPRQYPDFGWTLLGRVLISIGNGLGTALLLQYLQFGLRLSNPVDKLTIAASIYTLFVLFGALVTGQVSDRIGRRKPFVLAAGLAQALAAIGIVAVSNFPMTVVAAALLGAGYGCFLGVDQALATQVLPDSEDSGKDLGIMNIAMQVPQALGPLIGALVVSATGGFSSVFVAAAVFGIAGSLAVLPIRGVR